MQKLKYEIKRQWKSTLLILLLLRCRLISPGTWRASYYFLGALLGRYSKGAVTMPGGCNFGGVRPIDQHIKGFEALGADVSIDHGMIWCEAQNLTGGHIYFDGVTVGATINVMLAAVRAQGLTILENVAKEPHVVDLANFLNSMGADVRGRRYRRYQNPRGRAYARRDLFDYSGSD